MKRILYVFICIIFIIIATFSLKKAIFMHNLKKSLNGVVINLGDFGDLEKINEYNENKQYIVLDYTKKKILKSKKYLDIFDSNNGKILYRKMNPEMNFDTWEIDTNLNKEHKLNGTMYYAKYLFNDILIFRDNDALFIKKNKSIMKNVICICICIENNYIYYITQDEKYKFDIYIYTKYHEHLRYDKNLKNKIWDIDSNEPSKKYSYKDFNINVKYLNFNKYSLDFENRFIEFDGIKNKNELFTKDKKYKIYFQKKQGYWDKRYLTLYVYAEEISTHKKLLLYKGSKVYYDEGMFNIEEFKIIKNNVYNWFVY